MRDRLGARETLLVVFPAMVFSLFQPCWLRPASAHEVHATSLVAYKPGSQPQKSSPKKQPVDDGTVMQVPHIDDSAPAGFSSDKPLQGHLTTVSLEPALTFCQPFGLTCVKEGKTELPARVVAVDLNSGAYHSGVQAGDRILKANAVNNVLSLTIDRNGQTLLTRINLQPVTFKPRMPMTQKNLHPFTPSIIAQDGPQGVLQGRYPNCWFEAALMAVAAIPQGQQVLSDMIVQNPDSTYSVVFRGDSNRTFKVSTDAIVSNQLINPAQWANVIEAAERDEFPDNDAADSPNWNSPKIKTGLSILTGHNAQFIRPDGTGAADLEQIIRTCLSNRVPIIIATKSPRENGGIPQVVVPNHAYAIVGFRTNTKMIILRNPLGDTVERDLANSRSMLLSMYGDDGFAQDPSAVPGGSGRTGRSSRAWPLPMVGEEREGVRNLGSGFIEMSITALQQYARYMAWSRL